MRWVIGTTHSYSDKSGKTTAKKPSLPLRCFAPKAPRGGCRRSTSRDSQSAGRRLPPRCRDGSARKNRSKILGNRASGSQIWCCREPYDQRLQAPPAATPLRCRRRRACISALSNKVHSRRRQASDRSPLIVTGPSGLRVQNHRLYASAIASGRARAHASSTNSARFSAISNGSVEASGVGSGQRQHVFQKARRRDRQLHQDFLERQPRPSI